MPELTPSEMDVLHILANWGPADEERIAEIRLAGAVAKVAAEMFDLVLEGYVDMIVDPEGVICVVGIEGPVPLSDVVLQLVGDQDISVFFDLEGEEDAQN